MEAMLSAIAGCMAIDVVDILGKMRKTVSAYAVECEGWRRDELPRKFTRIRLTHRRDIAALGQNRPEAGSNDWMIVCIPFPELKLPAE